MAKPTQLFSDVLHMRRNKKVSFDKEKMVFFFCEALFSTKVEACNLLPLLLQTKWGIQNTCMFWKFLKTLPPTKPQTLFLCSLWFLLPDRCTIAPRNNRNPKHSFIFSKNLALFFPSDPAIIGKSEKHNSYQQRKRKVPLFLWSINIHCQQTKKKVNLGKFTTYFFVRCCPKGDSKHLCTLEISEKVMVSKKNIRMGLVHNSPSWPLPQ